MYKFIKTVDEKNQFDITDVEIKSKFNDLTLEDMLNMFKSFLQACDFSIKHNEDLEFVQQFNYNEAKEIEIDLSEKQFNIIASKAHSENITFNEMVNRILSDQLDVADSEDEFESFVGKLKENAAVHEFDTVVNQLKEQDSKKDDCEQLDLFDQTEHFDRETYERNIANPPDSIEKETTTTQLDSVEFDTVNIVDKISDGECDNCDCKKHIKP